ncbi:MAG: hypothetical protein IKO41_19345 [Lachnospiraceae bacterium]|nr:hypothetical protein [Lachnospiraceae bacterium]
MKTKCINYIRIGMLSLLTFVLFISFGTTAQAYNKVELKQLWYETNDYPITVEDEEWYDYGMLDMFDILNPPQELLETYSAQKLAGLMMTHPYLWVLPSYEFEDKDYFFGYIQNSNIYTELFNRSDGVKNLLTVYRNSAIDLELLNSDPYIVWNLDTKVNAEIFGCQFIRFYAEQFDEEERMLADSIIAEKEQLYRGLEYEDTKRYLSFSEEPIKNTSRLAELIYKLENRNGFTATGSAVPKTIEGVNIQFTPGIYNKYGVNSSCLQWLSGDYSDEKRAHLDASIAYPWIMIDHSSPKYNCHSYAWIISSAANTYWLDSPVTFMGSSQITSYNSNVTLQLGDKIVYFNSSNSITHSAIVVSTPPGKTGIYVRSKIGGKGLYDSPLDEVGIYHDNSQTYMVYRW